MPPKSNDFNVEDYTSRLSDLEDFKKEYEGEKFYEKIVNSFDKSKTVNDQLEIIVWKVIKSKLLWVMFTGLGLIFIDLLLRAIPSIIKSLSS